MAARALSLKTGWLPIVDRELRVAGRQKVTYWNRALAVIVAVAIFLVIWMTRVRAPVYEVGQGIFYALSVFTMLVCLLSGSNVADSISREKREGTLGLLFLTNLHGYDIVAGKMLNGSLNTIYRVVAMLPIAAIAFLLGGVELGMYGRMVLACATMVFLSLAVAVYWSSRLTNSWAPVLAWMATMLFLTFGVPLLTGIVIRKIALQYGLLMYWEELMYMSIPSPAAMGGWAIAPKIGNVPYNFDHHFWCAVLCQNLMAFLIFISASRRTELCWQQKEMKLRPLESKRGVRESLAKIFHGLRWRRSPVGDEKPVTWMVLRGQMGLRLTYLVFALAAVVFLIGWFFYPQFWRGPEIYNFYMTMSHLWLLAWMSGEAATWVYRDRQSGALELILATPLQEMEILQEHFRGVREKMLGPVLCVISADIFFMFNDHTFLSGPYRHLVIKFIWLSLILMLLFNLYVLRWTGTWMALIARNEFNATVSGLLWLCLPTWVILMGGALVLNILENIFHMRLARDFLLHFSEADFLCFWLFLATMNNLAVWYLARRECLRLREYASQRMETGFFAQMRYLAGLFRIDPS